MLDHKDHTPRIYVACLASYNQGILHGAWISLSTGLTGDDVHEMIAEKVLRTSPVLNPEEWAVHDHENLPIDLKTEWPDLDALMDTIHLAEDLECTYPDIDPKILLTIAEDRAAPGDDLERIIDEMCPQTAESPADYAADWHENVGDLSAVPDDLAYHIDWQGVARDMGYNGTLFVHAGSGDTLSSYDDMRRGPCIVLQST